MFVNVILPLCTSYLGFLMGSSRILAVLTLLNSSRSMGITRHCCPSLHLYAGSLYAMPLSGHFWLSRNGKKSLIWKRR